MREIEETVFFLAQGNMHLFITLITHADIRFFYVISQYYNITDGFYLLSYFPFHLIEANIMGPILALLITLSTRLWMKL